MVIGFSRLSIQLTRSCKTNPNALSSSLNPLPRYFSNGALRSAKLQVGDRVVINWTQSQRGKSQVKQKLTHPLREDGQIEVGERGHVIKHADIIGKDSHTKFESVSSDRLRYLSVTLKQPSLDEFISLAPRRVAPIYASYASTIVSMLEIHLSKEFSDTNSRPSNEPAFQILEAGTGHGGLTLHLARAIAAANRPPLNEEAIRPPVSRKSVYKAGELYDGDVDFEYTAEMKAWRSSRNAVLHTIDIDASNRVHADRLIRSFRSALYWPHIDFYVGDVKDWVLKKLNAAAKQSSDSRSSFLDIAVLDMPGVEDYIETVASAIKPGGLLLVFQPQITQIAACVLEVATKKLAVEMETVLELGESVSTGRRWNISMASVKNSERQRLAYAKAIQGESQSRMNLLSDEVITKDLPQDSKGTTQDQKEGGGNGKMPPMICRPLVGEMTRGGGFVALWRKAS